MDGISTNRILKFFGYWILNTIQKDLCYHILGHWLLPTWYDDVYVCVGK